MDYEKLLSACQYAELRMEKSREASISVRDGEVRNSSGYKSGMSVRVLQDGSWGFASDSSGEADIRRMLEKALRLSRLSKGKAKLAEPESLKKEAVRKTEPVDGETKVKGLLEGSKAMEGERITSRTLSFSESSVRKEFYNSHGAEIIQETGYAYLSCSAVARSGDVIQRGSERAWSRTGFGALDVAKAASEAGAKALRLLDAAPPPKGRFTVVFDPEMTGVFSHEAVGHACEADSVIDRESILAGKIGTRIGNELVTIIDDPTAPDFGGYDYDDEGVPGRPTTLVEKGVLKSYLNSMESASELSMEKNGHARAEDYGKVPIVRMGNTYFQKGEASREEVFDIPSGVYLKGMKGGSVDIFSGGFMFKAEESYEIKGGQAGAVMRDVTITGNILQTLLNVERVGKDFGTSPGICGKFSQSVPVSDGGPHIRVRDVAIG
jgi:TldD protein